MLAPRPLACAGDLDATDLGAMTDDPAPEPQGAATTTSAQRTEKPKTNKEIRAERLAEALRSNLKRRKLAARARGGPAGEGKP